MLASNRSAGRAIIGTFRRLTVFVVLSGLLSVWVVAVPVRGASADGEGAGVAAQAASSVFSAPPVVSANWRGIDSVSAAFSYGSCAGSSCAQAQIDAYCRASPLTPAEVAALSPTAPDVAGTVPASIWSAPGYGPGSVTVPATGDLCPAGLRIVKIRLWANNGTSPDQYTTWISGAFRPALHAIFTAEPVLSADRRFVGSLSAAMNYDSYSGSAASAQIDAYCRATRFTAAEVAQFTATASSMSGASAYSVWQTPGYGPNSVTLALDGSGGMCAAGLQVVAVRLYVNNPTPDTFAWWTPGHPPIPAAQTYGCGCGNSAAGARPVARRADPVNTALGAVSEVAGDVAVPAAGIPFNFVRAYTSADTTAGTLGVGWSHSYNAALTFDSSGNATFRSEDGQQVAFVKGSSGGFVGAAGVRSLLLAIPTGYTLTTPDLRKLTFSASGQLTAERDRFGQGLVFAYTGGLLSSVTDSASRVFALTYAAGLLDRVTLPDGRYVGYGYAGGQLTSVRDLRGKTTSYAYDAAGRLASQTDPLGHRKFLNTYDAGTGRITSQLDALGKSTTFAWDAATQTARTTDPRGGVQQDHYDGNVLDSETDPLGNTTSYSYDNQLNRIAVTDARGNTTSMSYDGRGNMLTRTAPAPLSYVERWTYNADNQVLTHTDGRGNLVMSNVYDPATGLLSSVTEGEGGVTAFTYTAKGQVASVTDPRGKVTAFGYDADGNRTSLTSPLAEKTTMSYDASGRLLYTVDPRGNVTGGTPSAFTTSFAYDAGNLLTSTTDARGKTTAFGFDDAGRATSTTDALTHATSVAYDAANRPTSVTDAAGAVTSTLYDATGNPVSVTTPAGTTSYTYDLAGRAATRTDPRGNVTGATAAAYTWTFTRDANGNVTSVAHSTAGTTSTVYDVLNRPTSTTDALSRVTATVYDADSNVTSVTDPLQRTVAFAYDKNNRLTSQTDARGKTTTFAYDPAGHRTSSLSPLGERTTWTFDDDGRPATVVDPRGNAAGASPASYRTQFGYDPAGERTSVTDPLGHVSASGFDAVGNRVTATDPNGHATGYSYDAVGRLASVTAADSAVTAYGYDLVGNLTSRTDANAHVTSYSYDSAHRMTSLLTPIGGQWTFAYDAAGNRTRTVTAAGNATTTVGDGQIDATFDALNRQTGIGYSDTTPGVQFAYDKLRRTSMTDGAGVESYGYDAADQLTGVTRGTSGFAYGYDANGQVAKRTYPDGTVVDVARDDDGRMSSVTSGGAATSYAYDAAGNLITTTLPVGNGYVETRTVDAAGRLAQIQNVKAGAVLSRFALARDNAGNPLSVTSTRGTTSTAEAYTYDTADRLAKVCYAASCAGAASSIGYTYDGVGNRLTEARLAAPLPASAAVGALVNAGGLCAAVQGASTKANTAVILAACTGVASQQWTAREDGTLRSLGMCLEIASTATANGSVARINACTATQPYQRWTASDSGVLTGASSGRCLKANGAAGTQLVVFDCGTTPALRWQVPARPVRAVTGQAWNVAAANMCVSAAGSTANSAVTYAACDTASGKQWTAGSDGTMRALGVCMELPAGVTASGTPVRVNACSALAHQRWTAQPDGHLLHEASGRCLAVNGTATQLVVTTCAPVAAQNWSLPVVQTVTAYAYDTADQLTSTTADGTARSYGYDPNGNQTLAGPVTSTFDLANRTATMSASASTTAYTYDGAGKRLTSSTNGTIDTRYSWDANNPLAQLVAESTASGALTRRYVNGLGGPISMTGSAGTSYYHHDAYGSVSDVTSATGAAQWQYAYEPYGAARTTSQLDPAAPANPIRYTGQYQDPGGNYHLRARQYDPTIGRFTATDPLAPPITDPYVSAYAYVGNAPTQFGDPAGTNKCELGWNPARWGGNAVDCGAKAAMSDAAGSLAEVIYKYDPARPGVERYKNAYQKYRCNDDLGAFLRQSALAGADITIRSAILAGAIYYEPLGWALTGKRLIDHYNSLERGDRGSIGEEPEPLPFPREEGIRDGDVGAKYWGNAKQNDNVEQLSGQQLVDRGLNVGQARRLLDWAENAFARGEKAGGQMEIRINILKEVIRKLLDAGMK